MAEHAAISEYTWHDKSHTSCSRWEKESAPLAAVAKYAGHSTIQMTMRYAHLVPSANFVANSVVDAFYASATLEQVPTDTRTGTGNYERQINSRK